MRNKYPIFGAALGIIGGTILLVMDLQESKLPILSGFILVASLGILFNSFRKKLS